MAFNKIDSGNKGDKKPNQQPVEKKWGQPVFLKDKKGKKFRNPFLVAAEKGFEIKRKPKTDLSPVTSKGGEA